MDISLSNIWKCWYLFKRGKRKTAELDKFQYELEKNVAELCRELSFGNYRHGGYRRFVVYENKKREIAVASVRDRLVHRIAYEYLVPIFDKTFIYDVWSCRKNKGLAGAIERTQEMMRMNKDCFVWRADVKKFFDTVDQATLTKIISRRVSDSKALYVLKEIIQSYPENMTRWYERERERERDRLCHGAAEAYR